MDRYGIHFPQARNEIWEQVELLTVWIPREPVALDVQQYFASFPPTACHLHVAVRRNDFPKFYAMSWRGMGGDCQRIAVGRHSMWEMRSHYNPKLHSKDGTNEAADPALIFGAKVGRHAA